MNNYRLNTTLAGITADDAPLLAEPHPTQYFEESDNAHMGLDGMPLQLGYPHALWEYKNNILTADQWGQLVAYVPVNQTGAWVYVRTRTNQSTTVGVNSNAVRGGGTFANYNSPLGGANNWGNPGNAAANDANYAGIFLQAAPAANPYSNYLLVTNFGMGIPAAANITGIKVGYLGHASGGPVTEYSIRLFNSGSPGGADKADPLHALPAFPDAWRYRGGDGDTWGFPATPALLNTPAFGVGIAVVASTNLDGTALITYVELTTYYTLNLRQYEYKTFKAIMHTAKGTMRDGYRAENVSIEFSRMIDQQV